MPDKKKDTPNGSIRFKKKGLHPYERKDGRWVRSEKRFPNAEAVIKLYCASGNLDALVDKKDPRFLKGILLPDGTDSGARINCLPDGRLISKAFNLFARDLTIHDQNSNDHWDVLYRNKGGTYSYVYTVSKIDRHRRGKYEAVARFEKVYPALMENVTKALRDKDDHMVVPMYTLLATDMRIGNQTYFAAHGHQGLTTLRKRDIKIVDDVVEFKYIAKDGVPRDIIQKMPKTYVKRLQTLLSSKGADDFAFTNPNTNNPLPEAHFKKAFKRYCGYPFYPHIVRSYYATNAAKEFIKSHEHYTKEQVREFFTEVAHKLGHKKYDKKEGVWKEDYKVTVACYIQPKLVEKIRTLYE